METTERRDDIELSPQTMLDLLASILHPPPTAWGSFFKFCGVAIGVLGLVAALFLSSPAAPANWVCEVTAVLVRLTGSRESAGHMCEWTAIVSQVAIVLFIGGAAFTESFARKVASIATQVQVASIEGQLQKNLKFRKALNTAYVNLINIDKSEKSYFCKAKEAFHASTAIFGEAHGTSSRYIWFAVRGFAFNFPGGLYGFLGFIFLFTQVLAVSLRILLAYLPSACVL